MRVPNLAAAHLALALLLAGPVMAEDNAAPPSAPAASAAPAAAPPPVILNKNALPADMMPAAPPKAAAPAEPGTGSAAREPAKDAAAAAPANAPDASESSAASAEDAAEDAAAREFKPDAAGSGSDGTAPEKAAAAAPPPAPPSLNIDINLTSQRMTVTEDGHQKYSWAISSARSGYKTPTGTFKPSWMSKMWYSRQYDYAPMPHAIFFSGGTAIHATYATSMLGRPASHGCVRLSPGNAATLYKMVNRHGKSMTRITVHGVPNHREPSIARNKYKTPRYASIPPGYRYGPGYASSNPYGYQGYGSSRPRKVYRTYTTPPGYYTKPRRYVQRGYYSSYPY